MRIGFIDWASENLYFYIFEKKRNQYTLKDTISIPLKGGLNQDILSPLSMTGTKHVYLSVPVDSLSLRELEFPFSERDKIKETISYELEGLLLGDVNDYTIDHIITRSRGNGCKALAVCMEKARLNDMVNTFSSAGLDPEIITSIDLRLSGGDIERLLDEQAFPKEARADAAREELENPSINLRQEEAHKRNIERLRKNLRTAGVLTFILLLILGANTLLRFMSLKEEYSSLTRELHTIYRKTFPEDTRIVDPVRQFKGNYNMLMKKKEALLGIPVLHILLDIAELKDKNIILHEFKADRENIIIKGTATSFEDIELFKNTLSSSFASVKVLDSKASSDKKVMFSIAMKERTTLP